MSGYGSLTHLAVAGACSSFCLELNEPQYLWQVLTHPDHRSAILEAIGRLRISVPQVDGPACAVVSEELFPEESRTVIRALRHSVQEVVEESGPGDMTQPVVDALMLPFVGRLACVRPSYNPTHVKRGGGICVLRGWQTDYETYLGALTSLLLQLPAPNSSEFSFGLAHGDARSFDFAGEAFDGVFTSPPYPNRADYAALFRPENDYLSWIRDGEIPTNQRLIGSVIVSGRSGAVPVASSATRFLERADQLAQARGARSAYDQKVYYRPYFEEYFAGLEQAWRNVATGLAERARGLIVVVNNTHRGAIVPVAEFACEVWRGLGFDAWISDTSEHAHVGTKNPRARGVRAIHSRHVVEIRRG